MKSMVVKLSIFSLLFAVGSVASAQSTCKAIEQTSVSLDQKPYRLPGVETWHMPIVTTEGSMCRKNGGCIVAEEPRKAKNNENHGRVIFWGNPKSAKPLITDLSTAPKGDCMNGSFYPDICVDSCRSISMPKKAGYKPGQVLFIPGLMGKICDGKPHDGCVVVAESVNPRKGAGLLFIGRCLSPRLGEGLCRDQDTYANERSVNSVGATNVWLAPDNLATQFKQELAQERKKTVAKVYQLPESEPAAKDPIPVMPTESTPATSK